MNRKLRWMYKCVCKLSVGRNFNHGLVAWRVCFTQMHLKAAARFKYETNFGHVSIWISVAVTKRSKIGACLYVCVCVWSKFTIFREITWSFEKRPKFIVNRISCSEKLKLSEKPLDEFFFFLSVNWSDNWNSSCIAMHTRKSCFFFLHTFPSLHHPQWYMQRHLTVRCICFGRMIHLKCVTHFRQDFLIKSVRKKVLNEKREESVLKEQ